MKSFRMRAFLLAGSLGVCESIVVPAAAQPGASPPSQASPAAPTATTPAPAVPGSAVPTPAVPAPVVPAPPPQVSASPPPPPVSAYRINPGDELEVYVWGEDRLQRVVRVLPDGTFAYPLVGQIMALGRLPQDIEAIIYERLRSQYRGQVPQVTVSVKSPSGMQFSVMGKVNSPGTFTPGRYVNIIEALSLAGGPAEFANLDDVLLLRKQGDKLTTTRVRLAGLFRSGGGGNAASAANSTRLETGDTIIVP